MNWAHIHLLLNHVPVIVVPVAILFLAVGLRRRSGDLARGGLALFVLTAVAAVAVYLTGEPSEELVEGLPGVSETILERHEEIALLATTAIATLGLLALAGLFYFRRKPALPRWFGILTLFLSLVPAGLLGWTASLGGQVRHSEIRPGFTAGETDASPTVEAEEWGEH